MMNEKTIDQINIHDIMNAASGGLPPLHSSNLKPSLDHQALQDTISITAECISTLYSSLLLLGKPFADRLNENFPETAVVYQNAIMNQFVPAFSRRFPDFTEFNIKVLPNGAFQSQNDFTATVLTYMMQIANAPVGPGNKVHADLIYTPSLPQQVWTESDLYGYVDHDDDDYDQD